MSDQRDLLIEIGTEELPPKALLQLSAAFEQGVRDGLEKAGIPISTVERFATPRRLAVFIRDLPVQQPDRIVERRGPALTAAFKNGQPTPAATGFARSCGVTVDQLQQQPADKGACLVYRQTVSGSATADLVPDVVRAGLASLPIPKRMRWGNRDDEFVRPVHWVVLLWGDTVIPATIMGVDTGRITRGHRFHCLEPITLRSPSTYVQQLAEEGHVLADIDVRRAAIRTQVEAAAAQLGGTAVIRPELLDEVTALVEWPVALAGNFDPRFLDVPAEALISTMQDHQRYFPMVDSQQHLLPHFITVMNVDSRDPAQVRAGNERVIRPRFSDAEFFWNQDRKQPLAARMALLEQMVFQQKLGTLAEKCTRVAALARQIAAQCGADADAVARAAHLSKCDLMTQMVQEFPELQGIMGRYYALHDGEPPQVAHAIEAHYLPRFSGDRLPETPTGRILALADRLDTLLGIFAIGQPPSGAKDPFALRRAALGVLRIVIESPLDVDLQSLLIEAAQQFAPSVNATAAIPTVLTFLLERLRGYFTDQGVRPDTLEAVLACRPTRPCDFAQRVRAVDSFRRLPEATSLTAANKRMRNLLKKAEGFIPGPVHVAVLTEAAETVLAERLHSLSVVVIPLMEAGQYEEALQQLATLHAPIDAFFENVLVMADDLVLRQQRISLLHWLSELFLRVADFSQLQESSSPT